MRRGTTRRDFLRLGGASAGSLLFAGCSGGNSASGLSALPPPTPPPPSPGPPRSSVSEPMRRLRDYLRSSAVPGMALPALASPLPDIGLAGPVSTGSRAATTLPTGVDFPVSGPEFAGPVRDQWSASLPGSPSVNGHPCLVTTRSFTSKGKQRDVGTPTILRFRTDAPVFELVGVTVHSAGAAAIVKLVVDGKTVPARVLPTALPGAAGGWIVVAVRVEFGSRTLRDVWVGTTVFPALVRIDADSRILPPVEAYEPQITVVGDSYLQQVSVEFPMSGALAAEFAARLGIRNVAADAVGGTGFWNSGGDLGNFNDRLPAHARDRSTIYLVMGGLNDYGDVIEPATLVWPSAATYEHAVTGYFANLRAALPDALIVVTAPFCPVPPMSDSSYVANPGTNVSGVGDFLYKASLHKRAIQQVPGPWVYVDVLMGEGWLNSSGVTGDVTNLQWFTGGTAGPGTSATYKPGNTRGGGGGGFGGIARVPVLDGGRYSHSPAVAVSGGSGRGLQLSPVLEPSGALRSLQVVCSGVDYAPGEGLPRIEIDPTYAMAPATLGTPELIAGVNPDGRYPLPEFAPPGAGDLNNIYRLLRDDTVHPSPLGVEYLARRLARNVYDAVMAL